MIKSKHSVLKGAMVFWNISCEYAETNMLLFAFLTRLVSIKTKCKCSSYPNIYLHWKKENINITIRYTNNDT